MGSKNLANYAKCVITDYDGDSSEIQRSTSPQATPAEAEVTKYLPWPRTVIPSSGHHEQQHAERKTKNKPNTAAMMATNTVDMQQLLMSIDPTNGNQELFNQMSKGAMVTSGGSASPSLLASSGAPSSSSIANEGRMRCDGGGDEEKEALNGGGANPWLSLLLQQQQQQQQNSQKNEVMDIMQHANPQILELLAQNGNVDFTQLVGQLAGRRNAADEASARDGSISPKMVASTSDDGEVPPAKKTKITDEPTTTTSQPQQPAAENSLIKSAFDNLLLAQMSSLTSQLPQHQQQQQQQQASKADESAADEPSSFKCHECDKEFENVAFLEQHKLAQHTNLMAQRLFGGLFPSSISGLPLMFQSPLHQQFTGMQDFDSPLSSISTPKIAGVKRQYSSNGKNYCDLCNKEVCNKYFLRTHMLKMHRIVIDENKTVIANIDTLEGERMGGLSFRCDTCFTEFKSRNQLRQHKQDVHGVMPLSTPRSANKASVPSTPTSTSAPIDEKCQLCDKRVPTIMMSLHIQQEHLSGGQIGEMAPDLSQIMAVLNQATRGQSNDSDENAAISTSKADDPNILKCTRCQYTTWEAKNLEMHQERHEPMNDVKRRGSDDDEDDAMKLTKEAALKMVVRNQFDTSDGADALNLTIHKSMKKDQEEEKSGGAQHERNSHTSGSISPSGESLPEGFGKPINSEKSFPLQTFIVRSNDEKGAFLGEFLIQIPVRNMVDGPRRMVFDLLPTGPSN
ncbi:unnamed protein product [Caenorhabditis bovis]|uniref:C2H2-type domain-containing protein n=1 Tax=Caenorhabditis bovis TaxID=2654633 RepID=A0A8S1FB84_9PELO|nr:unnamed protein product [Caenorhabditis bovis]